MKKLAFLLFVAILGLGMTGIAFALPWTKIVVTDDVFINVEGAVEGFVGPIAAGDKVKIVFKPTDLSVNQLTVNWGTAGVGNVKVKIGGQGLVAMGPVGDAIYDVGANGAGKIKLKLIGLDGGSNVASLSAGGPTLSLASLGNSVGGETPTAAPEPATLLLLGSGLVGIVGVGRRKFFKK